MAKQTDMIPVAEAARLLKVTTVRIRAYIHDGRLPAQQIGRAFVLRRTDVEAFERQGPGRPKKT
jgi:excisionase family DNA binding protein